MHYVTFLPTNRPFNYNQFHPLLSPNTPSATNSFPRYTATPVQLSPLPPIPGYPPGLGPGSRPKLLEENELSNSEEIYESIEGEDEYESSYIAYVDSVPNKPPASIGESQSQHA